MTVLRHQRGATFRRAYQLKNKQTGLFLDLTDVDVMAQIRNAADMLMIEATVGNGRLAVDVPQSTVTLDIPAADMLLEAKKYFFNLRLEWADGTVIQTPSVDLIIQWSPTHG